MSAVCTCKSPVVVKPKGDGDPYCSKCGHWWITKYGSADNLQIDQINRRRSRFKTLRLGKSKIK